MRKLFFLLLHKEHNRTRHNDVYGGTMSLTDVIAPTRNAKLLAWVDEVAQLTQPDRVVWCDGSEDEWNRLTSELVAAGTII